MLERVIVRLHWLKSGDRVFIAKGWRGNNVRFNLFKSGSFVTMYFVDFMA